MLLDPGGRVLASTDPADADRAGQPLANLDLDRLLEGKVTVRTGYSQGLKTEIADVMAPVVGADQNVLGIVRLSHQLTAVRAWFQRVRILAGGRQSGP